MKPPRRTLPLAQVMPCLAIFAFVFSVKAGTTAKAPPVVDTRVWHLVDDWKIEGQGWAPEELKSRYDRLPAKAEGVVRKEVWRLSRHSSGLMFRFNTDATHLSFRYTVASEHLQLPHIPATAVSGIDIYALDHENQWRWVSTSRPTKQTVEHEVEDLAPGKRTYMVYLPLFTPLTTLSVGVPEGSTLEPVSPREEKPLVFYGTSITHGASASRAGMPHPSILGRRLNLPVVNLGFSGNGRLEIEVAALMAELDAAAYIIDCLPNVTSPEAVTERTEPLVHKLRELRSDTPIILVEDRTYGDAWIKPNKRERHRANRAALAAAYDRLIESGVRHLYYLGGEAMLGDDSEGTVDGTHPTDLGFFRQADAFEPVLKKALGLK